MAKRLIKSAKENGAQAVKIQTYTADSMTIKSNKTIFKLMMAYGRAINYGIYTMKPTHL